MIKKRFSIIMIILTAILLVNLTILYFQYFPLSKKETTILSQEFFIAKEPEKILPGLLPLSEDIFKKIDINLKKQVLSVFENERLFGQYPVSSGKPSTPTKAGNFSVISKYEMAYGSGDGDLWAMPYFLGIYAVAGEENGIHALPYINGRLEGKWSLGRAVSHGCIRLETSTAKELFNWASTGTPVIIHY